MYWVDAAMIYLMWIAYYHSQNNFQKYYGIPHSTVGEVLKWIRQHVFIYLFTYLIIRHINSGLNIWYHLIIIQENK